MQILDTNVLARWLLNDDPVQAQIADDAATQPFLLIWTVFTELGWVLEKAAGVPRPIVAQMMEQLLTFDNAHMENAAAVEWAIERYRLGADWADMMHLAAAPVDADSFVTFDKKLARQAGEASPLPVKLLKKPS
ncbi:putative nucleic-acid-binding protein [Blastomonas natatoria]|uniref:Putative nucleic-acid-binding protein n=1 Tax=Blastomonas natatoria TaxID=34015 RepID=A0A2V3USA2_9SPHN|nr:type II toxin-antitoxin system VapC family toxin [Blastomonas natatoria]PXW70066.1 putative nucleic-acid-binding protein [Blastomonas natatoria]